MDAGGTPWAETVEDAAVASKGPVERHVHSVRLHRVGEALGSCCLPPGGGCLNNTDQESCARTLPREMRVLFHTSTTHRSLGLPLCAHVGQALGVPTWHAHHSDR